MLWLITCAVSGADAARGGCSPSLRGQSGTLWEGGVRGVGLVRGLDLVMSPVAGGVSDELYHISDWFPTILALAGITLNDELQNGFNIWPSLRLERRSNVCQ